MPEELVREVNDCTDFLLWKNRHNQLTNMTSLDSIEIGESDFSDYLSNLEEYETRLAINDRFNQLRIPTFSS